MWVRLLLMVPAFGLGVGCVEEPGAPIEGARCSTEYQRIAAVRLPHSLAEAALMGFDLDGESGGDRAVDNQLGSLSASLSLIYDGWRPDDALSARLAAGDVGWLLAVERCEADPAARIWLARAVDDGDGRLRVTDAGIPAEGTGTFAGGGTGLIPIGHVTDGGGAAANDAWEAAAGLTVDLRPTATGLVATVGVGLRLDDRALEPAAAFLTAELAAGSRFAAAVDTDRDGMVTVTELRASPTVRTLLAADLDLDADGANERLSIGFEVRTVPVTVE